VTSQTDQWQAEARRLRAFLEDAAEYHVNARNESADIRIIDGPASELIPPGRGRSVPRGMGS
jgi:hypothetical protein